MDLHVVKLSMLSSTIPVMIHSSKIPGGFWIAVYAMVALAVASVSSQCFETALWSWQCSRHRRFQPLKSFGRGAELRMWKRSTSLPCHGVVTASSSRQNVLMMKLSEKGYGDRAVKMGPCITRQGFVADVWRGRIGRRRSRKVAGPIRAMEEETMWITASSAVALVVMLAAFAALGGYLLSMSVDNEQRDEEDKIKRLKEQGLYEKPEPTQYKDQGVSTRTRKRRISEE